MASARSTSGCGPTRSRPIPALDRRFLAVWEPRLEEGFDVVAVHLAGGISGTVGACSQGARHAGRARDSAIASR